MTVNSGIFVRVLFSRNHTSVYFLSVSKSCPMRLFNVANLSFNAIRENIWIYSIISIWLLRFIQWRIQRGSLEHPPRPTFLNILWKWNDLVSVRPNYFNFHGIFKKKWDKISEANPNTFIHMNPLSRHPDYTPVIVEKSQAYKYKLAGSAVRGMNVLRNDLYHARIQEIPLGRSGQL